jgi:DNA recombination protein RmuC
MNEIATIIFDHALTWAQVLLGLAAIMIMLLGIIVWSILKNSGRQALEAGVAAERAREFDDKVAEMNRLQAELTGRMQTMAEIFGTRQGDLVRHMGERLDALRTQVGQGIETSGLRTSESLGKLNERLAVIDAAQKNLTDLTSEVVSLRDVLANKQSRGAYGQGRMESIVKDGMPAGFYVFQPTLSNRTKPDCMVTLPGDSRGLVIDAKFPLEGFTAFRGAKDDDARRIAGQRVRQDIGVHLKDIAEKYLIPGETQDMALMFVPSESIYADLHEHFDDLIQRSHRARLVIVSPSLLALAIQVMQSLVRDARMRDEAQVIQSEVGKLLNDVRLLGERVEKLDTHFRQAVGDVEAIKTSSDKVVKRGDRIGAMEFDAPAQPVLPFDRKLKAAE